MRILVAGASGALGKQLVPMLVERGDEVTGTTRGENMAAIEAMGAVPRQMDGLDPDSVAAAVSDAEPEVVVHQLTALGDDFDLRRFERTFAITNRLRTEGTDHLLSAAKAVGRGASSPRASPAGPTRKVGGWVKGEDDPLDPDPIAAVRSTLVALRHLEGAVLTAGPGSRGWRCATAASTARAPRSASSPTASRPIAVRKRRFPVVGTGAGVWSLIHITDAATATVAAIEGARRRLQRRRRRAGPGPRGTAGSRGGDRRQAPAPHPRLAREAGRRRDGGDDDAGGARRLEREGEARARLAAAFRELAAGLSRGVGDGARGRAAEAQSL